MFGSNAVLNKKFSEVNDVVERFDFRINQEDKKLSKLVEASMKDVHECRIETLRKMAVDIGFLVINASNIRIVKWWPEPLSMTEIEKLLSRYLDSLSLMKRALVYQLGEVFKTISDKKHVQYVEAVLWKVYLYHVRNSYNQLMLAYTDYENSWSYAANKLLFHIPTRDDIKLGFISEINESIEQVVKLCNRPVEVATFQLERNNKISSVAGINNIGFLRRREVTEESKQKFEEPIISNASSLINAY